MLLLLHLGHHSGTQALWTKAVGGSATVLLLLSVAFLLLMLTRALFASRELISLTENNLEVLGKPLLFPVKFRHIRLSPVKDRFNNRFLLVGVPVGLRCRIGNLLAIDDKSLDVSPPPGGPIGSPWSRIFSHLSCWFSVDSARFLHRGDHGVDLREKLDKFLESQVPKLAKAIAEMCLTTDHRNRMKILHSGHMHIYWVCLSLWDGLGVL